MLFHIDFKSGKPVYLQLVDQVRAAAASGALRAGEALPSIRPLAEQLRVNRNTVAKAYAELESQGVIETQQPNTSPLKKDSRRRAIAEALDAAVVQAHHMQSTRAEFLALAEERYDAFEQKRTRSAASGRA